MNKKKPTFEEALKQLEVIAEQIEQGKIGLEESITQYEQGMALVKHCREVLANAEHRIQQLQARPDGTLEATELSLSPRKGPQHGSPGQRPGEQACANDISPEGAETNG